MCLIEKRLHSLIRFSKSFFVLPAFGVGMLLEFLDWAEPDVKLLELEGCEASYLRLSYTLSKDLHKPHVKGDSHCQIHHDHR